MNRFINWLRRLAKPFLPLFQRSLGSPPPVSRPEISLQPLEPRLVLSVNATFAGGVLDIMIQNDGGSTEATLMQADGDEFFVDTNGNLTYDDGSLDPAELRGSLADLLQINVIGDAGQGNYFWRDNFSAALSSVIGDTSVRITDVANVDISATARLPGDVQIQASNAIVFDGNLSIQGDLSADVDSITGSITDGNNSQLTVEGHTELSASVIELGDSVNDRLSLHSLSLEQSGSVTMVLDSTKELEIHDVDAMSLDLQSNGDIEVVESATINTLNNLRIAAAGDASNLILNGDVSVVDGQVDFFASDQFSLSSQASLRGHGTSNLFIQADGQGISMADGSYLQTYQGTIHLEADGSNPNVPNSVGNIMLGSLKSANTSLTAIQVIADGDITDATGGNSATLVAAVGGISLTSSGGNIGQASKSLKLDAAQLQFNASSSNNGQVYLNNRSSLLTIAGVSSASQAHLITAHALNIDADINVAGSSSFFAGESALAGDSITINNAAVVQLTSNTSSVLAFRAGDDIVINTGLIATTGNGSHTVTLAVDTDHGMSGSTDGDRGTVTGQGMNGNVDVLTSTLIVSNSAGINLNTSVDALTGSSNLNEIVIHELDTIRLNSLVSLASNVVVDSDAGDVLIGSVSAGGSVSITASNGAIRDAQDDSLTDISASGLISLVASADIGGPTNADDRNLELAAGSLVTAESTSSGSLRLVGAGPLQLDRIVANDGNVIVSTLNGPITADDVILASGNIRLAAVGGDLLTNADITSTLGSLHLTSSHNVSVGNNLTVSGNGTIYVDATGDLSIVGNLRAERQGILLEADRNITVTGDVVFSGNGSLAAISSRELSLNGSTITTTGSVSLSAGQSISMINASQISGTRVLLNATNDVLLESIFASRIGINAGNNIVDGNGLNTINLQAGQVSLSAGGRIGNSDPNAASTDNANAIDLLASIVSASASDGIYLQQLSGSSNISVGAVGASSIIVAVNELNLNGSVTTETRTETQNDQTGIRTTNEGSIKVRAQSGNLNINEEVAAAGRGDILLIADTGGLLIQESVSSELGNIHLDSAIHIVANGEVATAGVGTILIRADRDVTLNAAVTSRFGDTLVEAGRTLTMSSNVTSEMGDIGLLSTNTSMSNSVVDTDRNVWLNTIGNLTMTSSSIAGFRILIESGVDASVDLLTADRVVISAGGDIEDGNGLNNLNIQAGEISLSAGGKIGDADPAGAANGNANAIDVLGRVLAADATSGIYVQQLRDPLLPIGTVGTLRVGEIGSTQVVFAINEVNFNSSTTLTNPTGEEAALSGLTTHRDGPIKVVANAHGLLIERQVAANGSGDVLLQTLDGGSLAIQAAVASETGNIHLDSSLNANINAAVSTSGQGTLYIQAVREIVIDAAANTEAGDMLLATGRGLTVSANLSSVDGDIGLSGRAVTLSGDVATNGQVLLNSTTLLTMTGSKVSGGHVFAVAGADAIIDSLVAQQVTVQAGRDIVDGNGQNNLNITAHEALLSAVGSIGSSDVNNGQPEANANAIDVQVTRLAASSSSGVYIQATGKNLNIGAVSDAGTTIEVVEVNFNSSTGPFSSSVNGFNHSGITTTADGAIKIVSNAELIQIESELRSLGEGDVLVQTTAGSLIVDGKVSTVGGSIELSAAFDIALNQQASTLDSGTIWIQGARDLNIRSIVTTALGDMLLAAGRNLITENASLQSSSGDIGLSARGIAITTTALITGGDAWLQSERSLTMSSSSITADQVVMKAGIDVSLDLVTGNRVAVEATRSIIDANAGNLNIRAGELALTAGARIGAPDTANGQPDANVKAIDIDASVVAASATSGIYLLQVENSGELIVGAVRETTVRLSIDDAHFNSTVDPTPYVANAAAVTGITNNGPGSIKLVSETDNVRIVEPVVATAAGSILIKTGGTASISTLAAMSSVSGNIHIDSALHALIGGPITTTNQGTIYVEAGRDVVVNAALSSQFGDMLITAGRNLQVNQLITSTSGDIALSGRAVSMTDGDIATTGRVAVESHTDFTMQASSINALQILVLADRDVAVDELSATRVAMRVGGNIIDNNGADQANVTAGEVALFAVGMIGSSDENNGAPNSNASAIDVVANVIAASGASGVYIQQLAHTQNLVIGAIGTTTVAVNVNGVNFNSSFSPVSQSFSQAALAGVTSQSGPIKIVAQTQDLQIADAISAGANADVLLRTDDGSLLVQNSVRSQGGDIHLQSAENISVSAEVSTLNVGTILVQAAQDITSSSTITSSRGDIIIEAGRTLTANGQVLSTTGDIGFEAASIAMANGSVNTGGSLLVRSSAGVTMTSSPIIANQIYIRTATDFTVDLLQATRVTIDAGGSIIDGNGLNNVNIRADEALLIAGVKIGDSDSSNGQTDANARAIDLDVGLISAHAAQGIYLQQVAGAGDLIIGTVDPVDVAVTAAQVRFNSTQSDHTLVAQQVSRSGLSNIGLGVIKVLNQSGNLRVEEAISAAADGDVLLQATTGSIDVRSTISSNSGDIRLSAALQVVVAGNIATTEQGTILLQSGRDIEINATLSTSRGDILVEATRDITSTATITSTTGDVALLARSISLNAGIATAGNLLANASVDFNMSSSTINAAQVVVDVGRDASLGTIVGTRVAIYADRNILDSNGLDVVNVRASELILNARGSVGAADSSNGSPTANANAIDLEVGTLAVSATAGIYIQELAGGRDLVIGSVAPIAFVISVQQPFFNSHSIAVAEDAFAAALAGADSARGPLKIVTRDGSLTIANAVTVGQGGEALLVANGGTLLANAAITLGSGALQIQASGDVRLNASVSTGGLGSIYVQAGQDIRFDSSLTSNHGDMLFVAGRNLAINSSVSSTTGDFGIQASNRVAFTNSAITTLGNILVNATESVSMSNSSLTSATARNQSVLITAGLDVAVDFVTADRVAIFVGRNIVDANGLNELNIEASRLSMRAGGRIGDRDVGSSDTDSNQYAIDTRVVTVSASAVDRIYIQELAGSNGLTIDNIDGFAVSASVNTINFNSQPPTAATTSTGSYDSLAGIAGLGPIKIVTRDGDLVVDRSVVATGSGGVLLAANQGSVIANALIDGGSGSVTLRAGLDVDTNASLTTIGNGTIYVFALRDAFIDSSVSSANGDVLIQANGSVNLTGSLQSLNGDIGLVAGANIALSNSTIATNSDILLAATSNLTMLNSTASGNLNNDRSDILVDVGGDASIDRLTANRVAIQAVGNIFDNNVNASGPGTDLVNIVATRLALDAGAGVGASDFSNAAESNRNAIDIQTNLLAVKAVDGVYIEQLPNAGSLSIGLVGLTSVAVSVGNVNFNSTTLSVDEGSSQAQLLGITSQAGPIKVFSQSDSVLVREAIRAERGDILLRTSGPGNIEVAASITAVDGSIQLDAAQNISTSATIAAFNAGTIYVSAGRYGLIEAPIQSQTGDIYVTVARDLVINSSIASTSGDIALRSAQDIAFTGSTVNTSGNIAVVTGGDLTMSSTTISSTISSQNSVLVDVARYASIDLIIGYRIAIDVVLNLNDGNGLDNLNLQAQEVLLNAGGNIGDQDANNGQPNVNASAIDIDASRVAAHAGRAIYLQQIAGSQRLTIGSVGTVTTSFSVNQINFNSSIAPVEPTFSLTGRAGATTVDGPIKIVTRGSSLYVDNQVVAGRTGDILLQANGGELVVNSLIDGIFGNIQLESSQFIDINATVRTKISGVPGNLSTLHIVSGADLNVRAAIIAGEAILEAGKDFVMTNGTFDGISLYVSAAQQISLINSVLRPGGFAALNSETGIVMQQSSAISSRFVIAATNGDFLVDVIRGNRISLYAGGNIQDNNGLNVLNIEGDAIALRALGSIGFADQDNNSPAQNANALDISGGVIAASAADGVYLQQLTGSGEPTIGTVGAFSLGFHVNVVNFNSTTTALDEVVSHTLLSGITTTSSGSIKVSTQSDGLTVASAVQAGGSGDVLLSAGNGDITSASTAEITSGSGNIQISAGGTIELNGRVETSSLGTILINSADNMKIAAPLQTEFGNILLIVGRNLEVSANIASGRSSGIETGNIGIAANNAIFTQSTVSAANDLLIRSNVDIEMNSSNASADEILLVAGRDAQIDLLTANRVGINAGRHIIDSNGLNVLNVAASQLLMVAGGLIGDADIDNGTPQFNAKAIDTQVDTLAVRGLSGVYVQELQEGGDLTVGRVGQFALQIQANVVNFNSTTTTTLPLSLSQEEVAGASSEPGPIKIVTRDGNLTILEAVTALRGGDVLLQANGGSLLVQANIDGGFGDIHLEATESVVIDGALTTRSTGAVIGTMMIRSGLGADISITSAIASESGDVVIDSGRDILFGREVPDNSNPPVTASILTNSGDVALIAERDIQLTNSSISISHQTVGSVLLDAVGQLEMMNSTIRTSMTTANRGILIITGTDAYIDRLTSYRVAITAGQSIIDSNGLDNFNVRALGLSMSAGNSIGSANTDAAADTNANAIDLEVAIVSASASGGIYLQELASGRDLTIGALNTFTFASSINEVHFNSTSDPLAISNSQQATEGATIASTTSTNLGPIKVVVRDGSLTVANAVTANGNGDVLLRAYGGDLVVNAAVQGGTGDVHLQATGNIDLNALTTTTLTGTIYVRADDDIHLNADTSTVTGDLFLSAGRSFFATADVSSTSGRIAVHADGQLIGTTLTGGTISLSQSQITGAQVWLNAAADVQMSESSITARGTTDQNVVVIVAGGSVGVDQITGERIVINSAANIVDANLDLNLDGSEAYNLSADEVLLTAVWSIGAADVNNNQLHANVNAIDLVVGTIAARAERGVYLHQLRDAGPLTVGAVGATTIALEVQGVNFNSTNTSLPRGSQRDALAGITSTVDGPIKISTENTNLNVERAISTLASTSDRNGDILLRTGSVGSILVQASVSTLRGNIHIDSANDIVVAAAGGTPAADTFVRVAQRGSLLLQADRDIAIGSAITVNSNEPADVGDIAIIATRDISITSGTIETMLQSTSRATDSQGDIEFTGRNLTIIDSRVSAVGDVFVALSRNLQMTDSSIDAVDKLIANVENDVTLDVVRAQQAAVFAGRNIIDGNGLNNLNIAASELVLKAGGKIGDSDLQNSSPDTNAQAIDIDVATLAAEASSGIYLQEVSSNGLTIGAVQSITGSSDVIEVFFNSTSADRIAPFTGSASSGLTSSQGPIKLVSQAGNIIVDEAVTVTQSGDILLVASGNSSDILVRADIRSAVGHIAVTAGDDIVQSNIIEARQGDIFLLASSRSSDSVVGIVMEDSARTIAAGNIRLAADSEGDIRLSAIRGNHIAVLAEGSILDNRVDETVQQAVAGSNVINLSSSTTALQVGDFIVIQSHSINQNGQLPVAELHQIQSISGSAITIDGTLRSAISIQDGGHIRVVHLAADGTLNLRADAAINANGTLATTGSNQNGMIGQADPTSLRATLNTQAINFFATTLSASSADGVYLESVRDISIAAVPQFSLSVPRFNSQTDTFIDAEVNGIATTENGHVKLLSLTGSITATQTTVTASGSGDLLLQTLVSTGNIVATNSTISSQSGDISLQSTGNIGLTSTNVNTGGNGAIHLNSDGNINFEGQLTSGSRDVYIHSVGNTTLVGTLSANTGSIAVEAGGTLTQQGTITTDGDILIFSGGGTSLGTSTAASNISGQNVLILVGTSSEADLILHKVTAVNTVSIDASGSISGRAASDSQNIMSTHLALHADSNNSGAGKIGTLTAPLTMHVETLAAKSYNGVYLSQVESGGDVTVQLVRSLDVTIELLTPLFNSTTGDLIRSVMNDELSDINTHSAETGSSIAISLVNVSGSWYLRDGDADGYTVKAETDGSILVQAGSVGTDTVPLRSGNILIESTIATAGSGAQGVVKLTAGNWIDESSNAASVVADALFVESGEFTHLHSVSVNRLTANVGANGLLTESWQVVNAAANDRGDDFLDNLGADRLAYAQANQVIAGVEDFDPNASREDQALADYNTIETQFRFADTYNGNYSLYLRNSKDLVIADVNAGRSAAPNIYIETLNQGDMRVDGLIATFSSNSVEGGIVLLAGGQLALNGGEFMTTATLAPDFYRFQVINTIGRDLGEGDYAPVVGYLNARVFDGGEGIEPDELTLTSSQFVIRNQILGLSKAVEDYRTHVYQRVVMQIGHELESGFVVLVGYADGEVQQFDVAGQEGARTLSFNELSNSQLSISTALRSSNSALAFTRATEFDTTFLSENQNLPTVLLARRAADFFLFENTSAENSTDISDLTVERFNVENVTSFGRGATLLPQDVASFVAPEVPQVSIDRLIVAPFASNLTEIELQQPAEKSIEVSIYRVYFDDADKNGQADQDELPSNEEILKLKKIAMPKEQPVDVPTGERILFEAIGSSVEEIEKAKINFMQDHTKPSGAYAIIEKGMDGNEVVLEVFSILDQTSQPISDAPAITNPNSGNKLQVQPLQSDESEAGTTLPEASGNVGDENDNLPASDDLGQHVPVFPTDEEGQPSRLASGALLAASLWVSRQSSRPSLLEHYAEEARDEAPPRLNRAARRSRRLRKFN